MRKVGGMNGKLQGIYVILRHDKNAAGDNGPVAAVADRGPLSFSSSSSLNPASSIGTDASPSSFSGNGGLFG
jgi:hypothetical protein